MNASKTRTCLGCDGTGAAGVCGACKTDYCECGCWACQGSGVIEERIPASDALADAETLRLTDLDEEDVYTAREPGAWGDAVRTAGTSTHYHNRDGYRFAVRAGSAAFRAVPGLRG